MICNTCTRFILVILLLIGSFAINGFAIIDPDATYHSKVIPPAPSVGALGKYGNVPVNLSTGAPTVTIPLYEINLRNASLPISLSYSSNGVKVDAVASWVGMEWILNAGGVISRTVRGGPDENSRCNIPTGLEYYSPSTVNFLLYQWDNSTDTEPDIYNYNFNGQAGKFIIDVEDHMKIYSVPYNNLKIETNYQENNGIYSFLITTPEGIKYLFGENYFDTTLKPLECRYKTYNRGMKTAWHLKKIEYPTGETINLTYKFNTISYYTGISQTIRKLASWTCIDNSCPDPDVSYSCAQHLTTRTCHLEKITTSAKDSVYFVSRGGREDSDDLKLDTIRIFNSKNRLIKEISFTYTFPTASGWTHNDITPSIYIHNPDLYHRMFLSEVKIAGATSLEKQHFNFEYYDATQLPGRLSFSQDHWGFFNGKFNYDFVVVPVHLKTHPDFVDIDCDREPVSGKAEYGLLKKINYPTGGTTTFEYEQNTYSDQVLTYPSPIIVETDLMGHNCSDSDTTYETFTVPWSQSQIVSASMQFNSSEGCNYMKNSHRGKIRVFDSTTSTCLISEKTVRLNAPLAISVDYIAGHVYTARVISFGHGTSTQFFTQYFPGPPTWNLVEKFTGGMRIKRIIDLDNITEKEQTTRYYYGNLSNINVSSGVIGGNPVYWSPQTVKKLCGSLEDECYYINLYSNSVNNLYNMNGNNIMYCNVIKSNGEYFENGGESNKFLVDIDDPGNIVSWCDNNILDAPQNNSSWNAGQLEQQLFFKFQNDSFIPIKKVSNIYSDDPRKDTTLHGFIFRKTFEQAYSVNPEYICTQEDVSRRHYYCSADHDHWWWLGGSDVLCIAPGCSNHLLQNVCEYKDQIIPNYTALDNFDGIEYDIYIKWNHLDTVITKTYSISGQDSITESLVFTYCNPKHTLPNFTKSIDSKGDTLKSCFYYPQDYSTTAIAGNFQALIDKNIISSPIDQRLSINSKLTSGQTTKYNVFGQPVEINIARNELGSNLNFNPDNPYSYGTKEADITYFEDTHNIKSFQKPDNIQTVYLWAYHHSYPIAEITGATYSEIESLLQQGGFPISILQETTDDAFILNATNYVRSNLSSALIVSYTYDPQVGMISKTDAAGIKNTFEYDLSGRLSVIRDSHGNIIKTYDYHYTTQTD